MRMHADQAEIDELLVERLVASQFPEWAGLAVSAIPSSGTVNAMYRLGEELTVRLPLVEGGVSDIFTEYEWVPRLAPYLPVEVPLPVRLGEPGFGYPWAWSVNRWITGDVPLAADLQTAAPVAGQLALDLARLVAAFRAVDLPDAPRGHRGGPLIQEDAETRDALAQLEGAIDTSAAVAAWEAGLAVPQTEPDLWLHADLMPGNLLVREGRLAAVLDFGCVGTGDPACDLIPAWNLLPSSARETFRAAVGADDSQWIRGRARALSMALIQLPYYRETNPVIAANAQHVIDEVLADFTG
ncbi:aminoglycoside phosphotransferase family protein [Kribbella endophytica]